MSKRHHTQQQIHSEPKEPKNRTTEVVIAVIGLIGTIIAALLVSPLIEKWGSNAAPPSATAAEILAIQVTDTPLVTASVFTPVVGPGDVVDARGVVMAFVPAGKFTMGSNNGYDDEKPPHEVYLDAYYIDKYEVTNSSYKACVDTSICKLPNDVRHYNDPNYINHPVVYVDWQMAQTYCEWRGTRLPTEAEWEKAARGTDDRLYPWGDTASCEQANYSNCVDDTTAVGKYKSGASPYGIYDMAGNVWEWVADWYLSDYYQILGSDSSNPLGPTTGDGRGIRGGDWTNDAVYIRVANRSYSNSFEDYIGFRCARSESLSPTASVALVNTPTINSRPLPAVISDVKNVQMVLVSAGEFTMGVDNADDGEDATPAHTISLNAFYIDKYEVTNLLYKACVDAKICNAPEKNSSSTRDIYYDNSEFNNYPVINVNWNAARAYCAWRGARLPTEAEWEKGARGTDGRIYPWGADINATFANYGSEIGDTTVVGSYETGKSIYGAYDMAGNVYEWVADWYASGYYKASPTENPNGPELGKFRVIRGGSWIHPGDLEKTFHRNNAEPTYYYNDLGFRCAKDATP